MDQASLNHATLLHIARYRITLPAALQQTALWLSRSEQEARQHLEQLHRAGWVRKGALYTGRVSRRAYYYLTKQGAAQLSPETPSGWLKEDPKIRAFAQLAYCCLSGQRRIKLTAAEFQQRFPTLQFAGQRVHDYLVDATGGRSRLVYLRLDSGARGRWERVVSRVQDDLAKRWQIQAYRELIEQDRFQLAVMTALEEKASQLRRALAIALGQDDRLRGLPPLDQAAGLVHVESIPGLINLIAPLPRSE